MKRSDRRFLVLASFFVGAALRDQLRRPAAERTWHGQVFGVPYDFRRPTSDCLRAIFWNKDNPSILTPHPFGIGWGVNFYRLLHRHS